MPRERSELLLELARAQRAAGRLSAGHRALHRAAVFAEEANDLQLLSEVVTETVTGQYWAHDATSSSDGGWDGVLSRLLRALPPDDSVIRCRTLMLRAIQSCPAEAPEKVDEGCAAAIAMADRLHDGRLSDECLRGSLHALRRPDKVAERLELTHRLIAHSQVEGDARSVIQAQAVRVGLLAECGDLTAMTTELPMALRATQRMRLWNMWVALGLLQASWSGLVGDDADAAAMLKQAAEGAEIWSLTQFATSTELTRMLTEYWASGQCPEPSDALPQHTEALAALLHITLAGRGVARRRSRDGTESVPLVVGGHDHRSLFTTCLTAELAARRGDAGVAAAAVRWLERFSGRICSLGPVCLLGPVDAFLALACAASGDPRAKRFAERAVAQARRWEMTRVIEWLERELSS